MSVQCFWSEPTGEGEVALRRYVKGERTCPLPWGYHNASSGPIERIPYVMTVDDDRAHWPAAPPVEEYRGWPAWPTHCDCGYAFTDDDEWQVNVEPVYRGDGREFGWRQAPAGAMRDAFWAFRKGPDGIALQVRCPRADGSAPDIGDDWLVDGRARNCGLPDDNVHYCWVRKGDPRSIPPTVTVSKDGPTCAAGAGSIDTHRWHGFLRDGCLVE